MYLISYITKHEIIMPIQIELEIVKLIVLRNRSSGSEQSIFTDALYVTT